MKLSYIAIFLTYLMTVHFQLHSQYTITSGKALYSFKTNQSGKTYLFSLAFNFTSEKYIQYFLTAETSIQPLISEIEKRKKENPKDSARYIELLSTIKEDNNNIQYQPVYGSLANNLTITKWLEPYTKTIYCVLDSVPHMEWEVADDTMTIMGLKCQKAFGKSAGNTYEAWFTLSVPVSVAPFQLKGLPGFLVEMTNLTNKNHLLLTELNWPLSAELPDIACNTEKTISKEQRDSIFAKEDARARGKANDLMKAYEAQKLKKQN